MVLNEANSWSQPLVVFKNSDIELIIPDIRTAGWDASYASAFKKEGTYFTYLYSYGVQSHRTIRKTLYVNTRTRIAVVIENAFTPPTRVDLCKPDPSMPIDRITAIVKNVSDSFHGQSLDDAIAEQSYTVARMIACTNSPNSQDCTMSDAEYRAKHPRYPRTSTPTDILLAQIAPMTARQPNESCEGVPADQRPVSSPTGGERKSEPKKITQSQPFSQTAQQPSLKNNAQQPVPVAAPIAASSGTYSKAAQEEAEAQWRKSLIGTWVGKYNCAQGVTGLTLTIAESADGGLSGIFDFYPVPGGYRFTEGSYSGVVMVGPDGSFEFKPQRWISQPPGFIAVALSGHYVADAQRLQGQVTGAIGCTSFDLSWQRSQARPHP
jgi:hypothetical protein